MNSRTTIPFIGGALLAVFMAPAALLAQEGPPAPLPLEPVSFPEFREMRLSNGAQLIVVENHEQPVVTVNLRIRSGSALDPPGKEGLAGGTADMLNKGTKTRSAKEIAEAVDFLGASIFAGAGEDWTSATATTLTEFLDPALELLADVIINPTFPEEELEIERKRILTALEVELSQPTSVATRRFIDGLYGDHPYGSLVTKESVKAIGREDMSAFHRANYRPNNALFVVAGDVRPDDIKKQLEKHFSGWKKGETKGVKLAGAPARAQRTIRLYHKPGSVQAVVRMGHLIAPATDPDWPTLDVALRILGGGSQGWLYRTLREEKGYTYGSYATSAKRNDMGYVQAWAEVRNEVADSSLREMFGLLERLRSEPVPQADLALAKDYITGSFPREIETPQQVAGEIATVRLRGLPKDYLETYRSHVAAVDAKAIQHAVQQHLHPEQMLVIVVGDATQIYDKVAAFGKVELFDVEGQPIALSDLEVKAADVAFDPSVIKPTTLVYSIVLQGNPVGEITTQVTRETMEGRDVIKSTGSGGAMMMTIEQEVVFDAKTFEGISSRLSQKMGAQGVGVELAKQENTVSGSVTGMDGETREVAVDVPAGTLLPGMDDYAIWLADLQPGAEISVPAFNALSATPYTLNLKVVGETTVTVAAGEFEAYQLEVSGAQGTATVYARKAAPHVVLKQEPGGQPVVIELKEIK